MRYNKQQWVELFRAIGLTDDAIQSWHREFEKTHQKGIRIFLNLLE